MNPGHTKCGTGKCICMTFICMFAKEVAQGASTATRASW